MSDFFLWIEGLGYSTFVRESGSLWAFPMFLFMHTLGMAILVGSAAMIDFALLGLWPRKAPIKPLVKLYPLMWTAFGVNLFTGVSIFMKDANSYGRNFDFYMKIGFVICAVFVMRRIQKTVFTDARLDHGPVPGSFKGLAWASLLLWFCAMVAGRIIAYVGPVPGL
jgi:hypothetical protein